MGVTYTNYVPDDGGSRVMDAPEHKADRGLTGVSNAESGGFAMTVSNGTGAGAADRRAPAEPGTKSGEPRTLGQRGAQALVGANDPEQGTRGSPSNRGRLMTDDGRRRRLNGSPPGKSDR